MAGIKDVAKAAGVGVGTVSRVINNSGYVAEATREKVEDVMKSLNYTPNELARNLYLKKNRYYCSIGSRFSTSVFCRIRKVCGNGVI